jgi:galactokinase
MMQRAVKELFMVTKLQERAKANAGATRTGGAGYGGVTVVWYPGCRRHAWFDDDGNAITKRLAVKILESRLKK